MGNRFCACPWVQNNTLPLSCFCRCMIHLPFSRNYKWWPEWDSNPHAFAHRSEPCVSACYTIRPRPIWWYVGMDLIHQSCFSTGFTVRPATNYGLPTHIPLYLHGAGGGSRTHKVHGILTRSICQFCYTGRSFNGAPYGELNP